jgi:PAS domain S-box-containing protein
MLQIPPSKVRQFIIRYGGAVALSVFALVISTASFMGPRVYFTFMAAVALSAWFGGFSAGVVSLVTSAFMISYFLIEPRFSLLSNLPNNVDLVIFCLLCLLISWLEGRTHEYAASLQSTKAQLETILQGISDGITAQDTHFQPIYANQAATRILGFDSVKSIINADAELQRRALRFYDQQGHPLSASDLPSRRAIFNQSPSEVYYRVDNLESQTQRWIIQKSAPVFDQYGKPALVINILRDVTTQRENEMRLESEHHLLRNVLDNLPALVGVLDLNGKLIEANRFAIDLAGLKREDVIGKPYEQTYWWTYSPEAQTQLQDAIQKAAQGESPRYDARLRIGEDRYLTIDFMISPVFDENGKLQYLIPAAVDITARKQAELERSQLTVLLAAERQRLKAILDNVPGVVWEANLEPGAQQVMTFVSEDVENVFGYPAVDWFAKPNFMTEIIYPDDRARVAAEGAEAYKQGEGISDYRVILHDGRIVHVETRFRVLSDDSGKPKIIIGITTDITHRKNTEIALEQAAIELKRSNEELQRFAYIASHDLQEPLRMVTSYLQLVEQRYKDKLDQDGKDFIGFAVDGAARMKLLINDLLTYSRVDTGGKEFKPTDLQAVLQVVMQNLGLKIQETQASIVYGSLPTINADEQQIVQLFQNLIGNALKFQRENVMPQVQIDVEKHQDKFWLFAIRDNGIGIESQYLERIFILFQRLHTQSKYPGTGIGLAICRKVVERHGGKIWVESKPEQGTTFYFTLPARENE